MVFIFASWFLSVILLFLVILTERKFVLKDLYFGEINLVTFLCFFYFKEKPYWRKLLLTKRRQLSSVLLAQNLYKNTWYVNKSKLFKIKLP